MNTEPFYKRLLINQNIVLVVAVSTFLPFYITGIVIITAGIYIMINQDSRSKVFSNFKDSVLLLSFSIFTAVSALFHGNWIGFLCSVCFWFIMSISQLSRFIITKQLLSKIFDYCIIASMFSTVYSIIEKIMNMNYNGQFPYRCSSFFFNPNYFGTMLIISIAMCAYKLLCCKANPVVYISFALINLIGLYLTYSMFVWFALFIVIAFMLILLKKYDLLKIFLVIVAVFIVLILLVPEIIPRLADGESTFNNRFLVWNATLKSIPDSLFFGKGFLSYFHLATIENSGFFYTTHAHNILLDSLLSFGIIGTILLGLYFVRYIKNLFIKLKENPKSTICIFIISILMSIVAHSLIDLTMLWIQSGMIIALLLSLIGIEEKNN